MVALFERAPRGDVDAEGLEESGRDGRSEHGMGPVIDADREAFAGPGGEPVHGGDVYGKVSVLRIARERTESCVRCADLADTEQAVGFNSWRRRRQQAAYCRIHGGVAADHERDEKNDHCAQSGGLPKNPAAETQVVPHLKERAGLVSSIRPGREARRHGQAVRTRRSDHAIQSAAPTSPILRAVSIWRPLRVAPTAATAIPAATQT